ncbi:NHL repeat-containing protein [candidate division KSB1 bacterium]
MMKVTLRWVILLSLLFVCLTCGRKTENASIETRDGVKFIHNEYPLWKDNPEVSLEFVQKIGDLENPDENYLLYRPSDMIRDTHGNIYILEAGNHRIQKFDPEGNYLRTIGRQGQGPGELDNPYSMNLYKNSEIFVCDLGNMRIQVFSTEGELLRSLRMDVGAGKRFTAFRLLDSGEYLTRPAPFMYPNENLEDVHLLSVLNSECSFERGIGTGQIDDFGDFALTVFMSVFLYEKDSRDNIYFVYGFQNRIEKYSPDGTLLFRADRPLDIKPNTRPRNAEKVVLTASAVAVDDKDRVWISTAISTPKTGVDNIPEEAGTQYLELEIFNSGGILLGKIPQPALGDILPFSPLATPAMGNMRIYGDRIYFIDMSKEMCVYEYKIIEH